MKSSLCIMAVVMTVVAIWSTVGCESSPRDEVSRSGEGPPFGGPVDVKYAEQLWRTTLRDYRGWSAYPGFEGWQDGNSPHGDVVKYYINAKAARNAAEPRSGSIIVKENYAERKAATLMAVTVMQRIHGYDPDNHDWFWVKYAPDGKVLTNPKGMPLAGRVAKGMPKGCIACHKRAEGGDYLFVND